MLHSFFGIFSIKKKISTLYAYWFSESFPPNMVIPYHTFIFLKIIFHPIWLFHTLRLLDSPEYLDFFCFFIDSKQQEPQSQRWSNFSFYRWSLCNIKQPDRQLAQFSIGSMECNNNKKSCNHWIVENPIFQASVLCLLILGSVLQRYVQVCFI